MILSYGVTVIQLEKSYYYLYLVKWEFLTSFEDIHDNNVNFQWRYIHFEGNKIPF